MNRSATTIHELVQSVLAKAGVLGAKELQAWKRPQVEIRKLVQCDYGAGLRRQLSFDQVKELVSRATDIWPHFNRAALGPASEKYLSEVASALRLHLKAMPYTSLALYGFYVDCSETSLGKPLIYVNSAHHPVAVATTFCHEVGHHFCTEIVKPKRNGVRFYFDAAYSEHLGDQGELAADLVVSLGGYPNPAARAIFSEPPVKEGVQKGHLDDALFLRVRGYLKECYGFDFSSQFPPGQNFHYLAGVIHYAKLRQALLREYGI